ncbi:phosphatidate cytidylyltransferase [Gracilibacillus halophilus YIM-C55.5]|uniref:Phosphatidate cytidylyltransferase n=1 Tax=Gracilibacillus halophilus YIM-C55.5 TaxID=1308866 RepID=N4WTY3_9BACI|nr:phosphatidate cytidylyltransferase [Gracilibacillus halophilus]ENH96556.1 phosphatidate cytidylyltransferase [Gracilibacillus halophilus YIM-C55.5]
MKTRIITACLAILVFFPFIFMGGLPFQIVMYILATIGLFELLHMRQTTNYLIPSALTLLLLWTLLYQEDHILFTNRLEILMFFVLLLLAYTVLVKNKFTFEDTGYLILSSLYIGLGFYYFMQTRGFQEDGLVYIFYAILVILSTDTGAYFCGRAFGKRKLWPQISPKKTVEGAVGGILLACLVAVIFQQFYTVHSSVWILLVVTIFASIFAQVGDLVESAIKRHFDIKDSGNILPGHGGILDRFDSWLFVFPFLHFILF